jgi:hypothetical protein
VARASDWVMSGSRHYWRLPAPAGGSGTGRDARGTTVMTQEGNLNPAYGGRVEASWALPRDRDRGFPLAPLLAINQHTKGHDDAWFLLVVSSWRMIRYGRNPK